MIQSTNRYEFKQLPQKGDVIAWIWKISEVINPQKWHISQVDCVKDGHITVNFNTDPNNCYTQGCMTTELSRMTYVILHRSEPKEEKPMKSKYIEFKGLRVNDIIAYKSRYDHPSHFDLWKTGEVKELDEEWLRVSLEINTETLRDLFYNAYDCVVLWREGYDQKTEFWPKKEENQPCSADGLNLPPESRVEQYMQEISIRYKGDHLELSKDALKDKTSAQKAVNDFVKDMDARQAYYDHWKKQMNKEKKDFAEEIKEIQFSNGGRISWPKFEVEVDTKESIENAREGKITVSLAPINKAPEFGPVGGEIEATQEEKQPSVIMKDCTINNSKQPSGIGFSQGGPVYPSPDLSDVVPVWISPGDHSNIPGYSSKFLKEINKGFPDAAKIKPKGPFKGSEGGCVGDAMKTEDINNLLSDQIDGVYVVTDTNNETGVKITSDSIKTPGEKVEWMGMGPDPNAPKPEYTPSNDDFILNYFFGEDGKADFIKYLKHHGYIKEPDPKPLTFKQIALSLPDDAELDVMDNYFEIMYKKRVLGYSKERLKEPDLMQKIHRLIKIIDNYDKIGKDKSCTSNP